jgi:hypothetical protein
VRFAFGPLPRGETENIWLEWSVNPTDVARRDQTAAIYDGTKRLAAVTRTVTYFP